MSGPFATAGIAAAQALRQSVYHPDKVVADRLMVEAGVLKFPQAPALLAGCDDGRVWIANGTGGRTWPSRQAAIEIFTRHALATLDANFGGDHRAEAHHRRFEADLLAALKAQADWRECAGPLFTGEE